MASITYRLGKIFVGGLSSQTTKETLTKYFENFGEICDSVIMVDKTTNRSRGFGFVTLRDYSLAEEVLKMQTPHIIDGKQVECKMAIPKEIILSEKMSNDEDQQSINRKKIFVGGLHPMLKENDLRKYFEHFGEIDQCVIMHDKPSGKSRGFGFVVFVNETSVGQVMAMKNAHSIMGKWVDCKPAVPREMLPKDYKRWKKNEDNINSHCCSKCVKEEENKQIFRDSNDYMSSVQQQYTPYQQQDASTMHPNYVVNNYYIGQSQIMNSYLPQNIYSSYLCNNQHNEDFNSNLLQKYGQFFGDKTNQMQDIQEKHKTVYSINMQNTSPDTFVVQRKNQQTRCAPVNLFQSIESTSTTKPNLSNYFNYKLLDLHGENLSKLSSLSYENIKRVKLFQEDESEKIKYFSTGSTSTSTSSSTNTCESSPKTNGKGNLENMVDQPGLFEIQPDVNIDLEKDMSNENNDVFHIEDKSEFDDCFGPHKSKKGNKDSYFKPY